MKIVFARTGGIGGFRLSAQVDTETKRVTYGANRAVKELDDQQVKELTELVESSNFFHAASNPGSGGQQLRDAFEYSIEVESGRKRRQVRWVGEDAPDTLRSLVEKLERFAKGVGLK